MKMNKILLSKHPGFIVIIAVVIRVLLSWVFGSQVADIEQFHWMANIVASSENIFDTPGLFHYTPIAMFLPFWCLRISEFTNLPFHFVIKWPTIIADACIVIIIWKLTLQRTRSIHVAFLSALFYAINPVSLLITCFHGSYNIIFILFSLFSYAVMSSGSDSRFYKLAALSLGLAIGFRGFAVLFLPFFLMTADLDWRKKLNFVLISSLPSVITLIPFLLVDFQAVLRDTFMYSGVIDFGWIALARSFWFLRTGNYYLPGTLGNELLSVSKFAFLILYVLLIIYFCFRVRRKNLLWGFVTTILLFFTIYGGISGQYLVWLVPFATLFDNHWLKVYSIFATLALIHFYLFYFPKILFGNLPIFWQELNPDVMIYVLISNFFFWGICLIWFSKIIQQSIQIDNSTKEQSILAQSEKS